MEEVVQLAIMTALDLTLAQDNETFLAFPTPGYVYTRADLEQLNRLPETAGALRLQAEFARLVNSLPGSTPFLPIQPRYCWDVYADITRTRTISFAKTTRTPAEETALQTALDVVSDTPDERGFRAPSAKKQAYDSYRDAHFATTQALQARKLEVDKSTDPLVRTQWETLERASHEQRVRRALELWRTLGFKDDIEDAQQLIETLNAKAPGAQWRKWRDQFDPNIDLFSDVATGRFAPTGVSPANFMASPAWPRVRLGPDEVRFIAAAHNPALRRGNTAPLPNDGKLGVSFEYTTVTIQRPWFSADLLRARFWRTIDAGNIISTGVRAADGAGDGDLSGYAVACVFVRNVTLDRPSPPLNLPPAWTSPPAQIEWPELPEPLPEPISPHTPAPFDAFRDRMLGEPRRLSSLPHALAGGAGAISTAALHADDGLDAGDRIAAQLERRLETDELRRISAAGSRVPVLGFNRAPQYDDLMRQLAVAPPPPPPAGTTRTSYFTDNSAVLLALVCKATPVCPNPDTTLSW